MLRILLSLLALLLVPLNAAAQAVTHEPTATPPNERVTYIHTDALGSPILGTDAQGNVVWREDYQPYGERFLGVTPPSQRLYTGKYAETRSGLVDFGGRWYNPEIGRFYSVDPQGFDEANPHSFNRYAYANNNPYRYVDPDGESPVDLVFLVYDVGKLGLAVYTGQGVGSALLDAGSSVLGAASPIPGAGQAIKAARAVDKAADVAKGVTPNAQQAANLNRFQKKIPSNSKDSVELRELPNGGVAAQATSPGKVPGSKAVYEKQIDVNGNTVQATKTTYDQQGNIVHVKDKLNGGTYP